jgi:hypothetical protein
MSWRAVRDRVHALLLSEPVWRLFPTLGTLYLNRHRVREPVRLPDLPQNEWSRSQRHDLLTFSEERMRNIEAKGPGLATVSAVIVAAVLLAIIGGWDESTGVARAILVLTALYTAFSLLMPMYLVGPLKRDTVHLRSIETAARADDPEEALAHFAAEGAMRNDLRNLRLANLLDAARRELAYALALLLLWVVLVPVTGLMRKDDTAMRPASGRHLPVERDDSAARDPGTLGLGVELVPEQNESAETTGHVRERVRSGGGEVAVRRPGDKSGPSKPRRQSPASPRDSGT